MEDTIRLYLTKAREDENPIRSYAKMISPNAIMVSKEESGSNHVAGYISIADGNGIHFFSYDELFNDFVLRDEKIYDYTHNHGFSFDNAWAALDKIRLQENQEVDVGLWEFTPFGVSADFLEANSFKTLHEFGITEDEVNEFYDSITSKMEIAQRITHMSNWLDSIDSKRKKLEEKSFIDDL